MFLLRTGPRVVTLHTDMPEQCCERLSSFQSASPCGFHEGLNQAGEDETLCLVSRGLQEDSGRSLNIRDLAEVFVVREDIAAFLVDFFTRSDQSLVGRCRPSLGPTIVLMRSTGSREAMLSRLETRYGGQRIDIGSAIEMGGRGHTLLALTEAPLNRNLSEEDIDHVVLLIPEPGHRVLESLRSEALVYITENLDTHEWYELRVNIYDSAERYDLHYRRLLTVLSGLELGMILGERWTEDHALALMSVLAFQVRMFTLEAPSSVKQVLVGLEYDENGNRLVDMDLYYRNRKVPWSAATLESAVARSGARESTVEPDPGTKTPKKRFWHRFTEPGTESRPKRNKVSDGIRCRKALIDRLPEQSRIELEEIEAELAERTHDDGAT